MDAANLKSWLSFDTSTTIDKCPNVTWTATGKVSLSTEIKKFGVASVHLPSMAYLKANSVINLNAEKWTFDCWCYRVSSSGDDGFFALSEGASRHGIISGHDGIYVAAVEGGSWQASNSSLRLPSSSSTWRHIAIIKDGTSLKFYQDGVVVWSITTSGLNNNGVFILGGDSYGYSNDLYFDNVRFFEGEALWTENFTPPTEDDYISLALGIGSFAPLEFNCDVERKISNNIEVIFDVERKVRKPWRYSNLGTADTLIISGTTLTNLPESKSITGTAFYQTVREKCFDLPVTSEIWIKFDVYFDGTNRWRAYNNEGDGTVDGISAQVTNSATGILSFFANTTSSIYQGENVAKPNQLQTVLLHMISSSSAGVVEAWVDSDFIYRYEGDVNHGSDFADIYLQSDGAGTFFSNVVISNHRLSFGDGYQSISFDVERNIIGTLEIVFDVQRRLIAPITVPAIDGHFNHFIESLTLFRGGTQRFILPKSGNIYMRGNGAGIIRFFSDNDSNGVVTGKDFLAATKMYAQLDTCHENAFIEINSSCTSQTVIRTLMQFLKNNGGDKFSSAIPYIIGGDNTTYINFADKFIEDLGNSPSYIDFLSDYCDIVLGNEDTGAISGSDASGGAIKTAESIVDEKIPVSQWEMPTLGSSTIINGLTVHWPLTSTTGMLTDAEKHIMAGLNSEWIKRSLDLIEESLGLSFNDEDVFVREINIEFENSASVTTLASTVYRTQSGRATSLTLRINMAYFEDIDMTSEDGALLPSNPRYHKAGYLDRTLAHEFTHAVMLANIPYYENLRSFIIEGTAELVHGIDDHRQNSIVELLTVEQDTLNEIVHWNISGDGSYPYAAGYIFLRYLAKQGQRQVATYIPNEIEITNLLISDGATDSNYNALTDNTRKIIIADILRTLGKTLALDFDIELLSVVPVEILFDVKRALLATVNLFARNSEDFFDDPDNPFVVRESNFLLGKARRLRAANLPSNTQGLQNFEVALAEQQITDQLRFTAVIPFDIMQQIKGQYLDYHYNMRVERVQQQGILYSCECCSDIDQLLFTQMNYKIPPITSWFKVDGEITGGSEAHEPIEIETVYPKASEHVNKIASALGLSPVIQFEDFLSTVLMDEQGGVTYNDLIRDIFGWSSRIPTKLINIFIREGKLFVIERGHESHTINISSAKKTMPVITKELVRTTWGSTPWSKTTTHEFESRYWVQPDRVVTSTTQPQEEKVREISNHFSGNGVDGYTTFRYDDAGRLIQTYTYTNDRNKGGQDTYTTVNHYYDNDGTMIGTDTFTQSFGGSEGQSASKSVDSKHYITLPNGEKFLSVEYTARWQNNDGISITDKDLVDSRTTVHNPSRVGQRHSVTVSSDGEIVGEGGGQNTGDDRVTPFRNKKGAEFINNFDNGEWKTQTHENGMTVHGLSLYDSSFPIHNEAKLIQVTNELRNLNRKTKETVNVTIYDFEHLIDFDDKIVLDGATYFLSANTARTTPRIKFEQNLTLVRWY